MFLNQNMKLVIFIKLVMYCSFTYSNNDLYLKWRYAIILFIYIGKWVFVNLY